MSVRYNNKNNSNNNNNYYYYNIYFDVETISHKMNPVAAEVIPLHWFYLRIFINENLTKLRKRQQLFSRKTIISLVFVLFLT